MELTVGKKKIFYKTIAMLLVFAMVFNLSYNTIFAIATVEREVHEGPMEGLEDTKLPEGTKDEPANIVGENTERRTLNEKHFLLDDGSSIAAVYPENVHYKKDGKLEDIDNTLVETKDENEFQVYENKANSFKVNFIQNVEEDKLVSLSMNDFEIKWSLQNAVKKITNKDIENIAKDLIKSNLKTNQEEKVVKESVQKINKSKAKILKKEEIKADDKNQEKTNLENISSSISYNNIINNIDLKYDINPTSVKESIIIQNREFVQDEFVFKFETGTLSAELIESKEIIIYNGEKNNVIYIIEAPYMFDSNLEESIDIEVTLEEVTQDVNNKEYIIKIIPNKGWLEDVNRAYPVTIDPTVSTSLESMLIKDTYIYSGDGDNWGKGSAHILRIGNSKWLGPNGSVNGPGNPVRSLIKFTLPTLNSGDQVIAAGLNIYNYPKTSEWTPPTRSMQIDVHKMTADWDSGAAFWNVLSGSHNPRIEDYAIYQYNSSTPYTCYPIFFDITSIAKDWYTTGNNYGLMLKEHEEIWGYTAQSDGYFISSDTSSAYTNGRPMAQIVYRNQTGLEDYLSYHTQSAGRAGTVYTNDYNGNLVLVHDELATPGQRMPIAIKHIYNTNDKDIDIGYGKGFRLNFSQTIELKTIGNTNYAKYVDEDGTSHYFVKQGGTNTYKDEDGLELTLTLDNDVFTMEDKGSNKSKFEKRYVKGRDLWHLKEIEDTDGNKITITFSPYVPNNFYITSVTDGAGNSINLYYDNQDMSSMVDTSGRRVSFSHDDNNNLTMIRYTDGKQSNYTYDSNNLLLSVRNIDNAHLDYEYYPEKTSRVKSIKEYSTANELGNALDISYGNNATKFTDNTGYSNTYTFNNSGQTISIADFGKEGNNVNNAYGKMYKYGDSGGAKNKLTLESKMISVKDMPNNLVQNPSFEGGMTGWNKNQTCDGNDTVASVDGNNMFRFIGDAYKTKNVYQSINVSGSTGDVINLSLWVKNGSVPVNLDAWKTVDIRLNIVGTNNVAQWTHTAVNADSSDWQFVSDQLIATHDYQRIDIYLCCYNNANETYFDNIGLFKEEFGQSYTYDAKGNVISTQDLAKQNSTFNYDGNNNLIKSINPRGGTFEYTYDTVKKHRLLSATNTTGIKYSFGYDNNGNATSSKIEGTNSNEYIETKAEYSEDGRYLTKLTDQQGNETKYQHNTVTGTVSKTIDAKGNETNYTYDSLDRVSKVSETAGETTYQNNYTYENDKLKTIVHNGFDYNFVYDNFGNTKQVKVGNQTLITNNYEARNGNLVSAVYGNNQTIGYQYDRFNRITSKQGTNGSYHYAYDAKSNLGSMQDNVNNETVSYTYDLADRLVQSQNTNGFKMQYGYDANSNVDSTKYTLNTKENITKYTFDKDNRINNIKLDDIKQVAYNYDALSRVSNKELKAGENTYTTQYTYENTATTNKTTTSLQSMKNGNEEEIKYTYDANGNIETISKGTELQVKYYYDSLNQLIREDNKDLNKTITYSYDAGGNVLNKTEYSYTTGALGTAENTLESTIENVYGKTIQSGIPTLDNPIPLKSVADEGYVETREKNLLYLDIDSYSKNGITVTKNNDGTYTLNGTATIATDLWLTVSNSANLNTTNGIKVTTGEQHVISYKNFSGTTTVSNMNVFASFIKESDGTFAWNYLDTNIKKKTATGNGVISACRTNVQAGAIFNNYRIGVQIEKGSTATEYEPYSGTKSKGYVEVLRCGKNLLYLDIDSYSKNGVTVTKNNDGSYTLNGTTTTASNLWLTVSNDINLDTTNGIRVATGEQHVISYKNFSGTATVSNMDVFASFIKESDGTFSWNYLDTNTKKKTATENGVISACRINVQAGVEFNNYRIGVQIEKGSIATEYEQYSGTKKQIPTTPLRSLPNGVADDMYTKRVAKLIFNGTEKWSFVINNNADYASAYIANNDIYNYFGINIPNNNVDSPMLCTHFKYENQGISNYKNRTDNLIYGYHDNTAAFTITVKRSDIGNLSTVEDWKNWVIEQFNKGTPLTIQLQLEAPILQEYTPISIDMAQGYNTITTTNKVQPVIDIEYSSKENSGNPTLVTGTKITINDTKIDNSGTPINYTYSNSNWKDQLTSYDGKAITYDSIGNPIMYNGNAYTWENGRQLKIIDNIETGLTISYKYNDSGIRTEKEVNGETTKYYLEGTKVIYEKTGNNIIYYTYDEQGQIIGLKYNDTQYYYIKNAQGDIIGILDNNLQKVVEYTYSSWGHIISIKDNQGNEIADPTNIGLINQYRYRSYRYDTETGLYYLQSRYYSPEWGRFINADGVLNASGSGLLSHNMYLYCANNPVTLCDPTGRDAVAAQIYLKNNPMPPIIAGPGVSNTALNKWKAGLDAAYAAPGSTASKTITTPITNVSTTSSVKKDYSSTLAVAGAVAMADSPAPGPADIVAVGIIIVGVGYTYFARAPKSLEKDMNGKQRGLYKQFRDDWKKENGIPPNGNLPWDILVMLAQEVLDNFKGGK